MWLKKNLIAFDIFSSILLLPGKFVAAILWSRDQIQNVFFSISHFFFHRNTIVQNFTNRCTPCANLKLSLALCSVFSVYFPAKSSSSSINICCPLRLYKHPSSDLLSSLNARFAPLTPYYTIYWVYINNEVIHTFYQYIS